MKYLVFLMSTAAFFAGVRLHTPQQSAAPQQSEPSEGPKITHGMWLCPESTQASGFFHDLSIAQNTGLTPKDADVDAVARKNSCVYVAADNLKIVETNDAPPVRLTDGKILGWAAMDEYLQYMHYHVVIRKP